MPRRTLTALGRTALTVGSGLVLAMAYAPYSQPWVVPLAVAGLLIAVCGVRPSAGFGLGLGFGVAFFLTHAVWMRAVSDGAWLGLAVANGVFYGLIGVIARLLWRRRLAPVWLAAAWTAVEGMRSAWPFGGMPWGQLAFSVVDTPLMRSLPYAGSAGVTFLLALAGGLIAALVLQPGRGRTAAGLVALVAVCAVPAIRPWHAASTRSWQVALVQPGFAGTDDSSHGAEITGRLVDATATLAAGIESGRAAQPDLVVWPEDATNVDPFEHADVGQQIMRSADLVGAPVLAASIIDRGPTKIANQGIVWSPHAGAGDRYTKRHPVPWGEYLPLRGVLGWLHFGDFLPGRDMVAGRAAPPLAISGVPVADAICFDVAHADVLLGQVEHGAELVTVQTSNVTFLHTDQLRQQFDISRVRAAETGRAVVIASLNGISGVIGPGGSVRAEGPTVSGTTIEASVPLVTRRTPAVLLGPWTWRFLALITVGGLAVTGWPRRRRTVDP